MKTKKLLLLVMLIGTVTSAWADMVGATYIDLDGSEKIVTATVFTSEMTELATGWYAVMGEVTIDERIVVQDNANVNIILCDGAEMNNSRGLTVNEGSSLTFWGQSNGDGLWLVQDYLWNGEDLNFAGYAAIGGTPNHNSGNITINGGTIEAWGGLNAAGIGGGSKGGATVTINGGKVTAFGGFFDTQISPPIGGAGIGGGMTPMDKNVNITINGGVVDAKAGPKNAAIGSTYTTTGTVGITINGGQIHAVADRSTSVDTYANTVGIGVFTGSNTTITLNWTDPSTLIYSESYRGTVILNNRFEDTEGNVYETGAVGDLKTIALKTLLPTVLDINIPSVENGSVASDKTTALYGETVTLALMPNNGCQSTSFSVTGATSGTNLPLTRNNDGTYSFQMPAESVNVNVTFMAPKEFVTDVMLIGSKDKSVTNNLKDTYMADGWKFINYDLNYGAGGAYIYLLYKSETSSINNNYITDFYIKTGKGRPKSISHDGRTYYPVPGGGGNAFIEENVNCDLNYDAGGDYIYLFYTKDPFEDNRSVTSIYFDDTQNGAVGSNGGTTGYDLNNKTTFHDNRIYMHFMTDFPAIPCEQAIWCSGNNTLYFLNNIPGQSYAPSSTYQGQIVTYAWNGIRVTDTGWRANPGWNVKEIKDACTKVVFDPSFAGVRPKSLHGWFSGFTKLKDVVGIENLVTSEVVNDMASMFQDCKSLKTIDVSGFDVSKVAGAGLEQIFYNCSSLTTIYCNDTWKEYRNMFLDCTNLVGAIKYQNSIVNRANPINGYFTSRTSLSDDEDNATLISQRNRYYGDVTLEGREFFHDGGWNTLCLPFNLTAEQLAKEDCPLYGATIKTLNSATFIPNTLTLNFSEDQTEVTAGTPYIVKWAENKLSATDGSPGMKEGAGLPSFLTDGNLETKWCSRNNDQAWFAEFVTSSPISVTKYTMTTANDTKSYPNRNPKAWTLKAKLHANDQWTLIDSRDVDANTTDMLPPENFSPRSYIVANPGTYMYFRLDVTKNGGDEGNNGRIIQLSEFGFNGISQNVANPVFKGVTLSDTEPVDAVCHAATFHGIYSPVNIDEANHTMLYLGADNKLYYPNSEMSIGSFRAYFLLNDLLIGNYANAINNVVFNFGDDATNIDRIIVSSDLSDKSTQSDTWYTIDGRKLSGKPNQKGIYINNGRRFVIK